MGVQTASLHLEGFIGFLFLGLELLGRLGIMQSRLGLFNCWRKKNASNLAVRTVTIGGLGKA